MFKILLSSEDRPILNPVAAVNRLPESLMLGCDATDDRGRLLCDATNGSNSWSLGSFGPMEEVVRGASSGLGSGRESTGTAGSRICASSRRNGAAICLFSNFASVSSCLAAASMCNSCSLLIAADSARLYFSTRSTRFCPDAEHCQVGCAAWRSLLVSRVANKTTTRVDNLL